jgi:hypothetical protein
MDEAALPRRPPSLADVALLAVLPGRFLFEPRQEGTPWKRGLSTYAAEAIRWYERQEGLWPRDAVEWRNPDAEDEYMRIRDRRTMAWFAFEIGDVLRAERWAEEALRVSNVRAQIPWRTDGDPHDEREVHLANVVLGRIALESGEIEEAERRSSLAANAWPRSDGADQWEDPDFTLARELLDRGRAEAVVSYLRACRETWVYGAQHIDGWIREIETGMVPDFRPWSHSKPSKELTWRGIRSSVRALRRRMRSVRQPDSKDRTKPVPL